MAELGYAYQGKEEKTARVQGSELAISPRQSYEVANALRGLNVEKAKNFLGEVIAMKKPVPYRRHCHKGAGHRRGRLGPGRFPVKTCREFIRLLNELQANAAFIGMDEKSLLLFHIAVHRGAPVQHQFKGGAHNTQVSTIEIIAKEHAAEEKQEKKPEKKKEAKK